MLYRGKLTQRHTLPLDINLKVARSKLNCLDNYLFSGGKKPPEKYIECILLSVKRTKVVFSRTDTMGTKTV